MARKTTNPVGIEYTNDDKRIEYKDADGNMYLKKSRFAYIALALMFGCFGAHNFYAGYTGRAVIQLLCFIPGVIFVIPTLIAMVWVIVEMFVVKKDANGVPFTG
ncbi:MAG: TM2 domain-containing protein [Lactobacillales bacterium]|jgi:TM2 domain-containing membrane protein YozV|nr:TM2 domain-containing protein [Lactobacillales bacterium]